MFKRLKKCDNTEIYSYIIFILAIHFNLEILYSVNFSKKLYYLEILEKERNNPYGNYDKDYEVYHSVNILLNVFLIYDFIFMALYCYYFKYIYYNGYKNYNKMVYIVNFKISKSLSLNFGYICSNCFGFMNRVSNLDKILLYIGTNTFLLGVICFIAFFCKQDINYVTESEEEER